MVDGPLSGIRILDLTHVWAGPLGVRFLADLGAEVVKVEAPFGRGPQNFPSDPIGGWLGGAPGDEPYNANALFTKLHRNRRSLCLDLKSSRGREVFLSLVAVADVVVENFSASAMQDMGLGYERLRGVNEQIIYLTMPGYGSTGPYSNRVAFGPAVEPLTGLSNVFGYAPGEAPRNTAMALLDPIGGTHAAGAVTAALRHRDETGHGARVELSLHECGICLSGPWLMQQQLHGPPQCCGNRHPGMAPHGVYRCMGEDQWLVVACADETQWRGLAQLLGLDTNWDLAARQQRADQIDRAISTWSGSLPKQAAAQQLQDAGVSAGPVNSVPDMVRDEQVRQREFFAFTEQHDVPMPGNPVHMEGLSYRQWRRCPRLGEDNQAILSDWLDMYESDVAQLMAEGVLADRPPG